MEHFFGIRLWLMVAAGSALLAWLLWKEWRRPTQRHRVWRLIATSMAVFSLWMLALQPLRLTMRPAPSAVLLTEGSSLLRLRQFLDTVQIAHIFALGHTAFHTFQTSSALTEQRILPVPDLAFVRRNFPDVERLFVFGYGIAPSDTADLAHFDLTLCLDEPPSGFRWIDAPASAPLGAPIVVRGLYHHARNDTAELCFADPLRTVDSLKLTSVGDTHFEFVITPQHSGQYLYTLLSRTVAGDTLHKEHVPLCIEPVDTLTVLLVESAPSFETRQLRAWLAARGSRVASRTTISKEKTATEFLNLSSRSLSPLNDAVLSAFEVLMLDAVSLSLLSAAERAALARALENGLGILLFVNDIESLQQLPADWQRRFGVSTAAIMDDEPREVEVRLVDQSLADVPLLPAFATVLHHGGRTKVLAHTVLQQPLATVTLHGFGHTGCSAVQETYRWALMGRHDVYAAYWSTILKHLARPKPERSVWRLLTSVPTVNAPLRWLLHTRQPHPLGIVQTGAVSDTFFLMQDVYEPTLWRGTYWARTAGWHCLSDGRSSPMWFYVFDQRERTAQRAIEQQHLTQYCATFQHMRSDSSAAQVWHVERWPLWSFFLLFVLAVGYLWAEQRGLL